MHQTWLAAQRKARSARRSHSVGEEAWPRGAASPAAIRGPRYGGAAFSADDLRNQDLHSFLQLVLRNEGVPFTGHFGESGKVLELGEKVIKKKLDSSTSDILVSFCFIHSTLFDFNFFMLFQNILLPLVLSFSMLSHVPFYWWTLFHFEKNVLLFCPELCKALLGVSCTFSWYFSTRSFTDALVATTPEQAQFELCCPRYGWQRCAALQASFACIKLVYWQWIHWLSYNQVTLPVSWLPSIHPASSYGTSVGEWLSMVTTSP